MRKTTGIIALAAASALVLSGCAADDTEPSVDTDQDTSQETTNDESTNNENSDSTEEQPTSIGGPLQLAPGEYTVSYNYTKSFEDQSGWFLSGAISIGADGSCDYDMNILDTGQDLVEGEIMLPLLNVAKSSALIDGLAYSPEDVNEDTFSVPEARSLVSIEDGLWNSVYDDQFMAIAMKSVGNYQGPCFITQIADLVEDYPGSNTIETDTDDVFYAFDAEKLEEYEEARLNETAQAMFANQENGAELQAAWVADQNRYAPMLSDSNSYSITQSTSTNNEETIIVSISGMTESATGFGTFTFEPLVDDSGIPYQVFLPEVEKPFTIGNYGAEIAEDLISAE